MTKTSIERHFPVNEISALARVERPDLAVQRSTCTSGGHDALAPLIMDQPEDSLDNKSIYEVQLLTDGGGKQDDRD